MRCKRWPFSSETALSNTSRQRVSRVLSKEEPPIFGMIQRGGQVGIRILEDVRQTTSQPLIEATIRPGTLVPTDEYTIYKRLPEWGFEHQTVYHNAGEDARDKDGDGFHEIHVNTMEGFWSLAALLASATPGDFPGALTLVSGLFRVRPQRQKPRQRTLGFPWIPFSVCCYVSSLESIKSLLLLST